MMPIVNGCSATSFVPLRVATSIPTYIKKQNYDKSQLFKEK